MLRYLSPSTLTLGLDNWLGCKFPSTSYRNKNPPSAANLWVGFYFLLLLLMYVKRAKINIPKRNIIVSVSFISMAPPLSEGKPRPPKIQLYLYCDCLKSTRRQQADGENTYNRAHARTTSNTLHRQTKDREAPC
jgi:hypothetical protein